MTIAKHELQPSDAELVAAARAGLPDAFTRLIERYEPRLLRYLYRQTSDAQLAADLTQETFLAAFRALATLHDERAFAAWLYQIARNALRMELRQRGGQRPLSLDRLTARVGALIPALQRPDSTARQHERDTIQQALDALRPAQREALLLHALWGFSGEEVAGILGIAPAAARKRIGRAEEQFRRHYDAHSTDMGPDDDDL